MFAGLGHRSFIGGHHQQREIDAARSREHVLDEAFVAGYVDDAHLPAGGQCEPGEAELDGQSAFLLLAQAVRVNAGERADERALAVIDVSGGTDDVHQASLQAQRGRVLG